MTHDYHGLPKKNVQVMDDPPNPKLQATTSCPGKSVTNATPYTPRNALGWCIGIWWFWCHGGTVDDLRLQGPGGRIFWMFFFLSRAIWMFPKIVPPNHPF